MEKIYKIIKNFIQQSDKKEKLFNLIMDNIKNYVKEIIEKNYSLKESYIL
jgi:hypothetical protein